MPLLLHLGLHPQPAAATSSVLVFISSLVGRPAWHHSGRGRGQLVHVQVPRSSSCCGNN